MKKNRRKNSQGQESASPEPSPTSAVPPPPLEWEEQAQCLGPILRYNSLPLVVTCDRRCLPPMEHINFDFSQPLLLHTRRTVRKVVAYNVVHVQHENETRLREVGDRLLIPEDYKGWFAVLGPPDEVKPEKVVPHFRQVAQLALSKCERFLIGGNEPVQAVQMPSAGEGADKRVQPRLIYPGDVLRMGKLYVGETTAKVKKPSLFGGKRTVKKEEKFLLCTDDNDRELYLPVESRGTFYMLTTEGNGNPKIPIMRMKDICTHHRFPCVIKLLFGRVPTTPCSFTGTLVLRQSQIESSVIGCTMLNIRNIMLDLPVDSDLRFFVARATLELLSSRAYKHAKSLCQDKASTYMRNMKVAYYVNNEEESNFGEAQEERNGDGDAHSSLSETVDNLSRIPRPTPSIVEDQMLFCPPETTPKSPVKASPISSHKKSKKSTPDSDTNPPADSAAVTSTSPTILRKDQTFNLPEPAESLPLRTSKSAPSLNVGNRPLPPIALPIQSSEDTPASNHYMSMEDTTNARSGIQESKPSTLDSKTPPPTPPKPRKAAPLAHSRSDENPYSRIWNGDAKTASEAESYQENTFDKPSTSVLRPKRLDVTPQVHRVSSIAFADTYLTLPVFRGAAASPATLPDDSVPVAQNAAAQGEAADLNPANVNQEDSNQCDKAIYKVPSSLPHSRNQPQNQSSMEDQPYEVMTTSKTKRNDIKQDSFGEEKPPTPPPKKRLQTSDSLSSKSKPLPPVPVPAESPGIVFENPSWMFSDTSSMQSCEHASRWLSSHHDRSSHDPSNPPYVPMQRESFTYYEGYEPEKTVLPSDKDGAAHALVTDDTFDQSAEQANTEQTSSTEESEALYANIQNLRLCKERLSTSNSVSDTSDDNHGRFLDKLANPPTMFGYVKAPPPRPVTLRKPPLPKKPSSEKMGCPDEASNDSVSFQLGCSVDSEARLPLPPKPCFNSTSATRGYLHPCTNRQLTDTEGCVQGCENANIPALLPQTRLASSYSDVSQQSSEDDLPLGATFANFRSRMSDSGCALESVVGSGDGSGRRRRSDVSSLSVADLGDALKDVGLTKETVEVLRQEKVDGRLLVSLNEEELNEALPGIKKLDIKKILMFVNGWRPVE